MPERLGKFDSTSRYDFRNGRSEHKAERFGKKYQWIALHELLARLGDNFHMEERWSDETATYGGPWQFYGRDIDPTLPPAPRLRDEDDVERLGLTYPTDREDTWWVPDGPRYVANDPPPQTGWATTPADIPQMEPLVHRNDVANVPWVVLQAYYNWDEERIEDEEHDERPRRDLWSHIYSWIVRSTDRHAAYSILNARSLMNRWMPQGTEITDDAYVAEMPWAAAASEYPPRWERVEPPEDSDESSIQAYAGWEQYHWEGNVLDCSIESGVTVMVPSAALFEAGGLIWVPGTRDWTDPSGELVAQYRESAGDRRSALLVRGNWLAGVLKEQGWSLIVGWLGEKQLFGARPSGGLLGGWTEINGVALFDRGKWTFGDRRLDVRYPR